MTENYRGCYEYLSAQYPEVGGYEFYKELFPDNENSGERHTDFSHPNAVYLYRDEQSEDKKLRRRKMYNDTWEQDYMEFVEGNSLTLCSGLAYRRKENRLENAQRMYALIFDLDGVGLAELRNLFLRFGGDPERVRRLPMPTFLVLSGTGLHIYYVFQQPIDLYPNIKIQLKSLKYDLTFRLWEYGSTSQVKAIQYQSINQSFRMVGSINDKHGTELVAFRTGERVTLDYLNAYAKPENRVDVNKPFSPSKMTRAEAREAYPEWYERVVVRGEKGRKKWDIAGKVHGDDPYALYHWWLRQIGEIKGGHRYFFLMCLAIYAYKCGVSKQQLRQDMKEAFDDLQMVKHENALTEEDIRSALEAYDKEYYNFTISDIEALTDVRIERNKRNGRSQKEHLKRARAVQEVDYPGGTWRRKGAEEKKAQVYAWRQEHPEGRKADCHRDTGLDPKTIRKWWDTVPEGHITVKIRPSQALSDLLVEEFKKGLYAGASGRDKGITLSLLQQVQAHHDGGILLAADGPCRLIAHLNGLGAVDQLDTVQRDIVLGSHLAHQLLAAHADDLHTVLFHSLCGAFQHSQRGVVAAHHVHNDLHTCFLLSGGLPYRAFSSSQCWKLATARSACAM